MRGAVMGAAVHARGEVERGLDPEGPTLDRMKALLANEYGRLRQAVAWNDWTEEAALAFGRLKEALERAGTPVGDMDVIIGSIALASGAGVATANARDFRRLPGLHVDEWPRAAPIDPAAG